MSTGSLTTRLLSWLVVVALVVAWTVSGRIGGRTVGRALDRAAAAEAAVAVLVPQRDSIRTANVELAGVVEAFRLAEGAARAAADSERAYSAARIAQAGRRASEGADALKASLDSAQAVQLGRIETAWGEVVATQGAQVEALGAQVATLERGVEGRDALILGLRGEMEAERGISAGLSDANEALHAAIRAQGRRTLWANSGTALAVVGLIVLVAL